MSEGKVRIGQIGVGYWGPNLLRNLSLHPRCEVVRVAELSQERRSFVEKQYPGVEVTDSHHRILDDRSINAVVIATPAGTHYELAMAALDAGKHILVEKPMACTVGEVEDIGALARQKKLVAMVGHTFVFNPAVIKLREIIDAGYLGQVRYIYSQRLNLGRIRSDVDVLWNLAPHDISIVQYLFGDPNPLHVSYSGMSYVQRGIDDVAFVNLTYPNKVMVNIHVSWLDPQRLRSMTIVGSDRMAIYDDAAEKKITIFDKGIDRFAVLGQQMDYDKPSMGFNHRSGREEAPAIEWREPIFEEISHFVECIQTGTECRTGYEHALKVVKILSACKKLSLSHETQIFTTKEEAPSLPVTGREALAATSHALK